MNSSRLFPASVLALSLAWPLPAGAEETTPAAPAVPAAATEESPPDPRRQEYADLMRLGEKKLVARDTESALIAFRQSLRLAKDEEVAPALINLARAHRLAGDGVKATATYEHLLREHPDWNGVPTALLELGRTLRELGAPRLAIARFYSVIQSTLRLPEAETEHYRRLVRTAQFEIAETHLATGNGAEAARFFLRLDLLELAPADRARARLRAAQAQLLAGDRTAAIATLTRFLTQNDHATEAAEARFLLARLYLEDGRREDALRVTLDLLRAAASTDDIAAWRGWQQRAGDFLAQRLKEEGQPHSALLLYRALALLDPSPAWRAPALYQIGLCLEQLEQPAEARTTYAELVGLLGAEPGPAHADLLRMAKWRDEQLEWAGRVNGEIRRLSPTPDISPIEAAPKT